MAEWMKLEDVAPLVNRSTATLRRWCRQGMPHIKEGRHTYVTLTHAQHALRNHAQADRAKSVTNSRPRRVRDHLIEKYRNAP